MQTVRSRHELGSITPKQARGKTAPTQSRLLDHSGQVSRGCVRTVRTDSTVTFVTLTRIRKVDPTGSLACRLWTGSVPPSASEGSEVRLASICKKPRETGCQTGSVTPVEHFGRKDFFALTQGPNWLPFVAKPFLGGEALRSELRG